MLLATAIAVLAAAAVHVLFYRYQRHSQPPVASRPYSDSKAATSTSRWTVSGGPPEVTASTC